ncbi:MAG: hypothetical protein NPIRA05_01700 [Nitrospirales bacterium]|nr:MAG: hypothetical protein NPIRA05_01700 [Nitrospirales bacterium]
MTTLIDQMPLSTPGRHLIRRQTIELKLACQEGAHEIQEEVRRLYHSDLLRVMDEVMSLIVEQDEVIQFDRLELDLGVCAPQRLHERLGMLTRESLTRVLKKEILDVRQSGKSQSQGRMIRAEDSTLLALQVFLRTGQRPWWLTQFIHLETVFEELLRTRPNDVSAMLRDLSSSVVMRRVSKQFSRSLQRQVIRLLASEQSSVLESLVSQWMTVLNALSLPSEIPFSPSNTSQEDVIYQYVLTYLVTASPSTISGANCSEYVIRCLSEKDGAGRQEFLTRLLDCSHRVLSAKSALGQWVTTKWKEEKHSVRKIQEDSSLDPPHSLQSDYGDRGNMQVMRGDMAGQLEKVNHPLTIRSSDETPLLNLQGLSESHKESPKSPLRSNERIGHEQPLRAHPSRAQADGKNTHRVDQSNQWAEPLDLREGLYIANAGLVLLWPFLTNFLEKVGLIEDKKFLSEGKQEHAVLLLQYLVTGEMECPEYELLLNKLLCGWNPSQPTVKKIVVSEGEQNESAELLNSVIAHWAALKKTSVEGFRRSFLLREGRLVWQETGWHLTVARTGYDVLLDRLPWGIGFILLPWMSEPLSVEW